MKDEDYLKGFQNFCIRWYFYLENGLGILNNFRNLFLAIFAIYITLKLTNLWWIAFMVVSSLIGLAILGWYAVHKIAKIKEWLTVRYSTYYGIKSFNYTAESYKELVEIKKLLEKK